MILVDTNYVARKIFHRDGVAENPTYFRHLFIKEIIKIKNTYKNYGEIILAKDNGSWRNDVIKEYKTTRKESSSSNIAKKYNFYEIFDDLLKIIKISTNIKIISRKKTEADDIIAILSKIEGIHVIYSGDKDLLQLIYNNKNDLKRKVDYYDFNKNMFIKKDKETILNLKNIHILIGDKVDDILKINWNSETTKEFDKWIEKEYNINMNSTILLKLINENSKIFNEFEKKEINKKIFKNPRLGKVTAAKIVESGDLENYLKSNKILNRNFKINQLLIDLDFIPPIINVEILEIYNNYKTKLPKMNELFNYCDLHNLKELKKTIKNII